VLDQRGRLLRAAPGFAGLPRPSGGRQGSCLLRWWDARHAPGNWAAVRRIETVFASTGW